MWGYAGVRSERQKGRVGAFIPACQCAWGGGLGSEQRPGCSQRILLPLTHKVRDYVKVSVAHLEVFQWSEKSPTDDLASSPHLSESQLFHRWELDRKAGWVSKNGCFLILVLEKTLESPLDCKNIKPVHPKGNQSWIFIGKIDAEVVTPILWPPDAKNWLIWKDPDAGKDWRQEEKGMTEDEMVGWHHWLNGHRLE